MSCAAHGALLAAVAASLPVAPAFVWVLVAPSVLGPAVLLFLISNCSVVPVGFVNVVPVSVPKKPTRAVWPVVVVTPEAVTVVPEPVLPLETLMGLEVFGSV